MSSITLSFHTPPSPTQVPPAVSERAPKPKTWRKTALAVGGACGLLLLLSIARFSFVRGWVRPIRIEGGSMAESLCGDHLRSVCRDCGYTVRCDVTSIPGDGELLCPNCGFPDNTEADAAPARGERVLVDSFAAGLGQLRRWDLVAISKFADDGGPVVKRLVALPDEKWEIRDGDLWIDGQIARKSLAQLREMMVTVNDDRFRPASQQRHSRWQPTRRDSAWRDDQGRFRSVPHGDKSTHPDDWLVYHHQRGLGATTGSERATVVKDLDAYNQAESRTLVAVNDLGASFRLQAGLAREFEFAVTGHEGRLTCTLDLADKQISLRQESELLVQAVLPWHDWRRPTVIEFGVCDEQFLIGLDGRELLRTEIDATPFLPTSQPLAIRVDGDNVVVSELRVWRDLHYLDPYGRGLDWQASRQLGDFEFAILGDNPPVSIDSRHAAAPIRRQDVWGHLCRPFRSP